MAILNWFHRKQDRARKEGAFAEKKTKPSVNAPLVQAPDARTTKKQVAFTPARTIATHRQVAAHKILKGAHITEKSAMGHQQGKYVFIIFPGVESPTVRQVVEDVYNVHVGNVQVIKVRPKRRHRGRFASAYKRPDKAIVTLRKGETIDIMS